MTAPTVLLSVASRTGKLLPLLVPDRLQFAEGTHSSESRGVCY